MASPKLIAGPILRRVDKKKVSVWVAFSNNYHCSLNVYEGDGIKLTASGDHSSSAPETPLTTVKNTTPTVQFGAHLWIAMITAEISTPGLQADQIYSYNVLFESSDDPTDKGDLRTEGLLSDEKHEERAQKAIGYKTDVLPTFLLPSDDPAKLFLAQASCRKMHGHGEDALSYLDKVVEDFNKATDKDIQKRPQQLFLTGDQIYADDVSGMLLRYAGNADGFSRVGEEMIRVRENNTSPIEEFTAEHVTFPPYIRQHIMSKYAGFTSGSADCHLIGFEEFSGVYLNYWSLRSWHIDFYKKVEKIIKDNKDSVLNEVVSSLLDSEAVEDDPNLVSVIMDRENLRGEAKKYVFDVGMRETFADTTNEKFVKWKEKIRSAMRKELREIASFASTLPLVSRVMANVPCYMIFDDHEITDDWYITQRWKNQVLSKPLGRDIIRNGLMAYAVFQDWGNVPDEYVPIGDGAEAASSLTDKTKFIRLINEYCYRVANKLKLDTMASEVIEPMEVLLGMGDEASKLKWHYDVSTGKATTYVLNTRTSRTYPSLNTPPGLISDESFPEQLPEDIADSAPFTLVISPVPVLGLASFEELIQPLAASVVGLSHSSGTNQGVVAGEIEFDFEAWSFNVAAFEKLLGKLDKYKKVILLSGDVHYGSSAALDYWKGEGAAPSSRIVQLTSSSSKNRWMENMAFFKSAIIQKIFTGIGANLEKVGWKDKVLSLSGNVSIRNRQRLRQNPGVIPVAGWQAGATVSQKPDYGWRLKFVTDERSSADEIFTSDIDINNATSLKDGYKKVVQRHLQTFVSGISKRLVWPSHVSKITFSADGEEWKVNHEFLFKKGDLDVAKRSVGNHIVHVISLKTPVAEATKPVLP